LCRIVRVAQMRTLEAKPRQRGDGRSDEPGRRQLLQTLCRRSEHACHAAQSDRLALVCGGHGVVSVNAIAPPFRCPDARLRKCEDWVNAGACYPIWVADWSHGGKTAHRGMLP